MIWTIGQFYADIKRELIESINTGLHNKFRFDKKYPKFGKVNVMGEHPFARMDFAISKGETPPNLFPAVSVSVQSHYGDSPTLGFDWEQSELTKDIFAQYKDFKYQLADSSVLNEIQEKLNINQKLFLYVIRLRYNQIVTLDIWADNSDVKDYLFETVWATLVADFERLVNMGINNITIEGRQDGFYNDNYLTLLYGSQIYLTLNNSLEVFIIADENEPSSDFTGRPENSIYYTKIKSADIENEYETIQDN